MGEIEYVAGIDEVGVGAWAGPVVAAAVVIDRNGKTKTYDGGVIQDSKRLTAKQRERAAEWIKDNAVAWVAGEASVEEITEMNILQASHLAMRRAVDELTIKPSLILIDGRPAEVDLQVPVEFIVGGDDKMLSIAAASIVAKVYRDKLMIELDKKYPGYGFASHKGYGTAQHKAALSKLGPTPCHRPTYAPVARALTGWG